MGLVSLVRSWGPRPIANWNSLRLLVPRVRSGVESTQMETGEIVLHGQVADQSGWLGKLATRMGRSDVKSYELEPIGAFVWTRIDGKHNLEAICSSIRKEFGLQRKEAEVSLVAFMRLLDSRGLIELCEAKK